MSEAVKNVMTTTAVMEVVIEIAPRYAADDLDSAKTEMLDHLGGYLSDTEGSLMTDYGTTSEELAEARVTGEWGDVTWGGYEGPYILRTTVRPVEKTTEDRIVSALADLGSDGPAANPEYLRGQIELAVQLLGYTDDGEEEKIALLERAFGDGRALFEHIYTSRANSPHAE